MTLVRIGRQELRQAWRAGVLAALGALVTLLIAGAGIVGTSRYSADQAQRERYREMVEAQWHDQPDRHPHRVAHYGFLVFRPRAPLGFFDTGVESFTGSSIFLEAHRQNSANFSDAAQAGGIARFGELTVAMVLQVFVALLVLITAGVSVTREREAETLWLLLCQGTSWASILWGKLWGGVAGAAGLIAPGLIATMAWLSAASGIHLAGDVAARAALLALAHALYLTACAALAVVVSSWHRTSRGALLTLVALWMALWVVLPRALPGLGVALYPVPARAQFEAQVERRVRELGDGHNPNDPKFQAIRTDYLSRYGVSEVDDLPVNYSGIVMFEAEKLTTTAYRSHLGALLDTYRRQARLVEWAGFLSPYLAIRTVSMALAGVDVPHAIEFERQAEEYRYELVQHLNALHTTRVSRAQDRYAGDVAGEAPTRQRISREHWQEVPAFEYRPQPVAWALINQRTGILALLGWVAVLLAVVAWRGRRLPVV